MNAHATLFEPLTLGSRQAKNRLFRASTTTNLAESQAVGARLLAHYEALARGGVGTIVTEALRMHPSTMKSSSNLGAFDPGNLDGFARWAETAHRHGALLIGQLGHSGRQHTSTVVPGRLVAPSPVACPRSGGVPHQLNAREIDDLLDGYRASADTLVRAGFDGVEINAAQGHLQQQFLSPFSNRRDDEYGGSDSGRRRFLERTLEAVREVSGAAVVGVRLGVEEFSEGGLTPGDVRDLIDHLARRGLLDYASMSQGNFNSIDAHLPDRHSPRTPFVHLQRQAGDGAAVPVVACTQIMSPDDAVAVLEQGWASAVALGRALTVDPDWPRKTERGEVGSIRLCIQCNHCWSGLHEGASTLVCVQNPDVGQERDAELEPTPAARNVVVVGGGPAGLEAARVAASRGHVVTLFEQRPELGGKLVEGARIGRHHELANAAAWLEREVRSLGVDLRLGEAASAETVAGLTPDAIVLATGARPSRPEVASDGSVELVVDLADLGNDLAGERVVLFDADGHYWAAQTTEELLDRGARVEVVTRFFEPFRELPIVSRVATMRVLDHGGVAFHAIHEVARLAGGAVHLRHYESKRETTIPEVRALVWVGSQAVNDELADGLRSLVGDDAVHLVGDVFAPRRLIHAIKEGNRIGRRL